MPFVEARDVALSQIPVGQLNAHYEAAKEFGKEIKEIAQAGEPFTDGGGRQAFVSEGKVLIEISPRGTNMTDFWRSVARRLRQPE